MPSQVWDAETVLIKYASYIFLLLNIFYIQYCGTKILTKIIRRGYGSRNSHFRLFMASQVWDAETVLIQYASYIFLLLNIFLHSKFWYQNTHKNNFEGLWKPKFAFSNLHAFSGMRRGNSDYSVRELHFSPLKYFFTFKILVPKYSQK